MYVLIVLLKEWKPQHHRFNNAKNSKKVRTIYNEVEFLRNLRKRGRKSRDHGNAVLAVV